MLFFAVNAAPVLILFFNVRFSPNGFFAVASVSLSLLQFVAAVPFALSEENREEYKNFTVE